MRAMEQQDAAVSGSAGDLRVTLAFEDFFEAERERLFRALLLITHDSAEAEDLMQEAFVRVWERWDRVGRLDDPVGYLFKTALNLRRSALRRTMTAAARSIRPPAERDLIESVLERDDAMRSLASLTTRPAGGSTRMRRTFTGLLVACLALTMALPAAAGTRPVYPPDSSPLAMDYPTWASAYFGTWLQEIPRGQNPYFHPDGPRNCEPVDGAIFVGPFGANCAVPAGVPIVFGTVAVECSTAEGLGDSYFQLRRCATKYFNRVWGARHFHQLVLIDGERLAANRRWIFRTPGEIVDYPARNIWHVAAGPSKSVTKGFLFILKPLDAGLHRIRMKAFGTGRFTVTWKLHVA